MGCCALGELVEAVEIVLIEGRGGGNRQRDAVHDHRIALDDLVEHGERLSAGDHVVLRDHLEPVDVGVAVEDVAVVRRAQAEPEAEIGRTLPAFVGFAICCTACCATFLPGRFPARGALLAIRHSHYPQIQALRLSCNGADPAAAAAGSY